MPDFGAPVADQITTPGPQQGIQTLGGLLGVVQAKQNLQLGQQKLQVGQSDVQQAQQQMQERELLQQAMASGKTPDGTPLRDANGEVDPVALAKFANTSLPLTGQAVQQSIIQTQQNRLQLNDAVRTLGQNYRNDISGIVRSAIGTNEDGQQIGANLDAYAKLNPNAATAIGQAKSLLQNLAPGMPASARNQALQHLAMQFQPAATTTAEQTPTVTTTTTPGGQLGLVQTNPYSAVPVGQYGEAQQGIPLSERQTLGVNPLTGGPVVVTKSGEGQITGEANAPTQGVYVPKPGDKEQIPLLTQQYNDAQQATLGAGLQHENNRIVLDNIGSVAATGATGPAMRNIASALGLNIGPGVSAATAYDMVGKGLERSALQAAQSMGPSTNAGLEAQIKANGTLAYTPQAIVKITRLNDAIVSGQQAYFPGLQKAINANPSEGVLVKRQFDTEWGANFDPRIFMIYQAQKAGDTSLVQSYIKQIGGVKSPAWKDLMKKAQNLNQLTDTGSLQK